MNSIRFATFGDTEDIMKFIHNYWKENHILSKNKKLFIYEYQDSSRINFVISRDKVKKINGLLGFIKSSSTNSDVWGAMWKIIKNSKNPMLGIELFQYLRESNEYGVFISSGINIKTIGIYNYLGIYTNYLSQYIMINRNCKDFNILKLEGKSNLKKISFFEDDRYDLVKLEESQVNFDFEKKEYIPHKDKRYFIKRYFNHPIYSYEVYGICLDKVMVSLIVMREVKVINSKVLRIMDFLGDENSLVYVSQGLYKIVVDNDYEYMDFMSFGFDKDNLCRAGFEKIDIESNKIIAPNYFAPFVRENIQINFMADTKDIQKIRICKADGDQDRPN